MRTTTLSILSAVLLVPLAASAPRAATMNGTVTLGGTIMNQSGDRSTVQETYNLYDGFTVYGLHLDGTLDPGSAFLLDLRDVNLDSRRGQLAYRRPGLFKIEAGFDQTRQLFSPGGTVDALRRNWNVGAQLTATPWLGLSGSFGLLSRSGDRLGFPAGTASVLGSRYDNVLRTGIATADLRQGRRGASISYRVSGFSDDLDSGGDRTGQVVSARLYSPTPFTDKWTHFLRASWGERRLSNHDLEHTLTDLRYTSLVEPVTPVQLRYEFEGSRVDDRTTRLKTDRFVNQVDGTWYHRYGQVDAGYGYETNDDDRTLTSYHTWHAGAGARLAKRVSARLEYASRTRKDQEELTLLKDVESSRIRARLEVTPRQDAVIGATYARREREFPDLQVDLQGDVVEAYGRYGLRGWGAVSADYSHSVDDYRDLTGGFNTLSQIVTGRLEFDRVRDLHLAGGVTYLDIGHDLDIEKAIVSAEGHYRFARDYRLELSYNVYNYDDYVLLDRYYTANVLRIGLGVDLHVR